MDASGSSFLIQQLIYSLPTLLITGVAFVLGILNLQHARKPAILTIVGAAILLGERVIITSLQAMILSSIETTGATAGQRMQMVAAMSACFHAIGFGLIVVAIFVDRKPRQEFEREYEEI